MTDPTLAKPGRIDLDSAAAARREALGAPDAQVEVVFLGEVYRLGVELPLAAIDRLSGLLDVVDELSAADTVTLDSLPPNVKARVKGALEGALAEVFCDEPASPDGDERTHSAACQWSRFKRGKPEDSQWRGRPSLQDMWVLFSGLLGVYGVSLGEALGPLGSLLSTGPLSRLMPSATSTSTPDASTSGAATPT